MTREAEAGTISFSGDKNQVMEIKVQQRNLILDVHTTFLVGGFKYFSFSPLFGEMIQFD